MRYIPVIGLEIHAELSTATKVFCTCAAEFGGEPNSRCCPRCLAMPGTLPVLNKGAVELAVKAGLALGCDINMENRFERKNYFYPDLPKACQVTQFERPVCVGGGVIIDDKFIRIHHIHIEEDAGKLVHDDYDDLSLADYNRGGIPLIEIVTEPDMRSAEQARAFVEAVALRLKYAGVCDAKMEQGSLRADVNISLMPADAKQFGTRVEIKNLNSFKSIVAAIEYEIERQSELLDKGGEVIQQTRRFNDNTGTTHQLRSKEEAHDYRYFPEPDIPPVLFTPQDIEDIRATLPEMPDSRIHRYTEEHGLSQVDAKLLTGDKALSDLYDSAVALWPNHKGVASLILVELLRLLGDSGTQACDLAFDGAALAKLVQMSDEGVVSKNAAKEILRLMFETGQDPQALAKSGGFIMDNDDGPVRQAVTQVLAENPKAVEEFQAGSGKVFGFLMGQTTRLLGKSANPKLIKEVLEEMLKGR